MARFSGLVGYAVQVEDPPSSGIWVDKIIEKRYFGDIDRVSHRYSPSGTLNDNLTLSNEISIIVDPYARENCGNIRYVKYMGTAWKVTSIDMKFPRIILSIGEIYNGDTPSTSSVSC